MVIPEGAPNELAVKRLPKRPGDVVLALYDLCAYLVDDDSSGSAKSRISQDTF